MESEISAKQPTKTPSRQAATGKVNKRLQTYQALGSRENIPLRLVFFPTSHFRALAASEVLYDNTEFRDFFLCKTSST